LKEATSKPVKANSVNTLKLAWRDHKYQKFYTVVDQLVDEIQSSNAHSFATVAASWTAVFSGAVSRVSSSCAKV
jgi:hypothetical protein